MVEIQDIFAQYGNDFRKDHRLPRNVRRAMFAIENCRTSILGGHKDTCDECGFSRISYNSCCNRHCPKCQTLAKERWIEARKDDLLNVKYFHVVFTIPHTLNKICFQNQKVMYNILFKAVSETLLELGADKKYLGARLGFSSILHTWGQNLQQHPHIHCIVPGGGLSSSNEWINSNNNFFIPVNVLSQVFRGKFLYYFKQAKLQFYGSQEYLSNDSDFQNFITSQYQKDWVVYCKPPFEDPDCVVEYLARYANRVGISNNRIVNLENDNVTFKWRDYKDGNKEKLITVTAHEFIRRFLLHILPDRFTKIRHFGLLSSRDKKTRLTLCKKLTNTLVSDKPKEIISYIQLFKKLTGKDLSVCPCCNIGHLRRVAPA